MPWLAKLPLRISSAAVVGMQPVMAWTCVACAIVSAGLLLWFLLRRPELNGPVKVVLFLGFGVFPIGSAMTGNVAGFEHTTHRAFCGSCHVMEPYRSDSDDSKSKTLAAMHARNEEFGHNNCYECHRDYGAFSTIVTKLGGMRHVYEYYTHYYKVDLKTALAEIELYEPFANASCIRCHSTETTTWSKLGDHRANLQSVRDGQLSCVSAGCHGPAHPFSKPKLHHAQAGR